mmetsp:Transcript_34435/g.77846  ORF Transcript_34435/g.77846 Transcript_34435/m.77846 type:complete len:212 (+) Transcript_34435:411-1046(+)
MAESSHAEDARPNLRRGHALPDHSVSGPRSGRRVVRGLVLQDKPEHKLINGVLHEPPEPSRAAQPPVRIGLRRPALPAAQRPFPHRLPPLGALPGRHPHLAGPQLREGRAPRAPRVGLVQPAFGCPRPLEQHLRRYRGHGLGLAHHGALSPAGRTSLPEPCELSHGQDAAGVHARACRPRALRPAHAGRGRGGRARGRLPHEAARQRGRHH